MKIISIFRGFVFSWLILFFFCFSTFEGECYYENLAGQTFNVKGEIIGMVKDDAEITIILKTDKNESVYIQMDDRKFKSQENILSSGNWVKMVVKVLEGGTLQGVSAQKIAKVVVSERPLDTKKDSLPNSNSIFDLKTLEIYKKTVKYFNPKLSDLESERIASSILTYSNIHKIDPRLVVAVIAVESDFQVDAQSVKGALGLGQLMPETARSLKVNPLNIEENILGTTSYLKSCLEQWKDYPYLNIPLALASYNAGPNTVAKYKGIPPYIETQTYVKKVMDLYNQLCSK